MAYIRSASSFAALVLILTQTNLVSAYWRLACSVSQEARIDPIISPGGISGHLHKFAGGINVQANSTAHSLQSASCSTCEVQKDKSAYWTPSLFYQHPDGTFESVPNDGMTVYYVGRRGVYASNTQPFPPGFRMISGNPRLRHYDTTALTYNDVRPIADRVSFRCINEANNIPETHYIDQTNCVNGLRAQINFQSCWDGQNLYLENNAHVAYVSGIDYGVCLPTHPVPIPGLFFEVLYWVNNIDQQSGGRFVLANGDPTGYSFHGDFINGWDQSVLTSAVQACLYTDDGGVVSACPALTPSDDVNFSRTCVQVPDAVDEPIRGKLAALPGCNPVTTNETVAPAQPSCSSSSISSSPSRTAPPSIASQSTLFSSVSPSSVLPPLLTPSSSLFPTTMTTLTTVTTSTTNTTSTS